MTNKKRRFNITEAESRFLKPDKEEDNKENNKEEVTALPHKQKSLYDKNHINIRVPTSSYYDLSKIAKRSGLPIKKVLELIIFNLNSKPDTIKYLYKIASKFHINQ